MTLYTQALFQHLTNPEKAVVRISKLITDEGIIAIEELDHGLWLSYPPDSSSTGIEEGLRKSLKTVRF